MIQLHHACCDGVGMRRVLIDALSGYAQPLQSLLELDPTNQPDARAGIGGTQQVRRLRRNCDDAPSGIADAKQLRWEALSVEALRERFDFSGLTSTPPKRTLTTWHALRTPVTFTFVCPQPCAEQRLKKMDCWLSTTPNHSATRASVASTHNRS